MTEWNWARQAQEKLSRKFCSCRWYRLKITKNTWFISSIWADLWRFYCFL